VKAWLAPTLVVGANLTDDDEPAGRVRSSVPILDQEPVETAVDGA
jgi:hypothetical protein